MKLKHQENAWAIKEEALKSRLSASEEVFKIKEEAWNIKLEAWTSKVGFQKDVKHIFLMIKVSNMNLKSNLGGSLEIDGDSIEIQQHKGRNATSSTTIGCGCICSD